VSSTGNSSTWTDGTGNVYFQPRVRTYRVTRPPPPGPNTVPVPEPLPDVLRWECVRLDRPHVEDRPPC
jgi:hypothetical protein